MSDWEVAFFRAVGLLWFCLAQTGEAGDSLGLFGIWFWDVVFGILVFVILVFGMFVFGIWVLGY